MAEDISAPYIATGARPSVAILREQGVNGHVEMAAAFYRAGFAPVDVHMSDILSGRTDLAQFRGRVDQPGPLRAERRGTSATYGGRDGGASRVSSLTHADVQNLVVTTW